MRSIIFTLFALTLSLPYASADWGACGAKGWWDSTPATCGYQYNCYSTSYGGSCSSGTFAISSGNYYDDCCYRQACEMDCPCSCSSLLVTGAEHSSLGLPGIFDRISATSTSPNRDIFQNSQGNYLYYWSEDGVWEGGSDYNAAGAWIYASASSTCPPENDWMLAAGGEWQSSSISVTCYSGPRPPPPAPPSSPPPPICTVDYPTTYSENCDIGCTGSLVSNECQGELSCTPTGCSSDCPGYQSARSEVVPCPPLSPPLSPSSPPPSLPPPSPPPPSPSPSPPPPSPSPPPLAATPTPVATQPAGPQCTCAEVNSFLQVYATSYTDGCKKATQNCAAGSFSTSSCSYNSSSSPRYTWSCTEASSSTTDATSSTTTNDVVTTTFTLSGDVSDYDTTKQDAMKGVFASAAGVDASKVTLTIAPASVAVAVIIAVADAAAATSTQSALSSGILASASSLQGALASGGVSGVTVESAPQVIASSSGLNPESDQAAQVGGSSVFTPSRELVASCYALRDRIQAASECSVTEINSIVTDYWASQQMTVGEAQEMVEANSQCGATSVFTSCPTKCGNSAATCDMCCVWTTLYTDMCDTLASCGNPPSSMGIIIGGAVGAVVVLGAIVAGTCFYLKKKKASSGDTTVTVTRAATNDVAGISMATNSPNSFDKI